jgi:WD40 repeat protein
MTPACLRSFQGAQKALTSGTITPDGTFLAGTADGRIIAYSSSGEARTVEGQTHTSLVTGIAVAGGAEGNVVSVGFDDQLREVDIAGSAAT